MVMKQAVDKPGATSIESFASMNAGVKQYAVFTWSNVGVANEEIVLGPTTYQLKATGDAADAGHVKITVSATTADDQAAKMVTAINASDPYFSAIKYGTGVVLITAKEPGVSGYLGRLTISDVSADAETVTVGGQIYEFDSTSKDGVTAGSIQVIATTTSATNSAIALAAAINANHPYVKAVVASAGVIDIFDKTGVIAFGQTATATLTYPNGRCLYLAETMTNGAWVAKDGHLTCTETCTQGAFSTGTGTTSTLGGIPRGLGKVAYAKRVCNSVDDTYDSVFVPLDFTPSGWIVNLRTTAGATKAWDGNVTWDSVNKVMRLSNEGSTDFADTDVFFVIAWE